MWGSPECRVPNDDTWLARKLRRTPAEIAALYRPLIAEFCQSDGNWITQKRLRREWEYVRNRAVAQSVRAKSRWDKEKKSAGAMQGVHVTGNAPSPTPSPTLDSEPKGSAAVIPDEVVVDLKTAIFGPCLTWLAKQSGKAPASLRSLAGRWCRDHGDGPVIEVLAAAQRQGPLDPIAWCEQAFRQRKGNGNGHSPEHRNGWAALATSIMRQGDEFDAPAAGRTNGLSNRLLPGGN